MNEDRIKALKAAGLTAFLGVAKTIPVAGNFIAAGGDAVAAYMDAMEAMKELPEAAQEAIKALKDDYRQMLQRESDHYRGDGETILALSLTATITLITHYGPMGFRPRTW